jgi:electron transport complex protein RnfA
MSYIAIVFLLVFSSNVALNSLFGLENFRERRSYSAGEILAVILLGLIAGGVTALSGSLLAAVDAEFASVTLSVALIFLSTKAIEWGARRIRPGSSRRTAETMERIESSAIAYAIGVIVAGRGFFGFEAVTAGIAAAVGFFAATHVLRRIMERSDLEDVPPAFKGTPILLINAGLLALVFSAFDAVIGSGKYH